VHFLLQDMCNGTYAGRLSDFGGRREREDQDAFVTAAREFCEETDSAFGTTDEIAGRLRSARSVRIINSVGRYVCFFHKVPYRSIDHLPTVRTALLCFHITHLPLRARCGVDGLMLSLSVLRRLMPPLRTLQRAASSGGAPTSSWAQSTRDDSPNV
jgi:hypothetical protein